MDEIFYLSNIKHIADTAHNFDFYNFDIAKFESSLRNKPESFWEKAGQKKALRLFHEAAKRVPAYKDFLKKNKISPSAVTTITDFREVPVTTKENYINQYTIGERSWGGDITGHTVMAVSSGTSGKPNFWPRGSYQEFEAAIIHELIFKYLLSVDTYKTLLVISFPMGIYVSGVATVLPSVLVSQKGYHLTVVSLGNQKEQALLTVERLKESYEQIVFVGHPFFVKDILEAAREARLGWQKKRIKMMFCSEGFNEVWRDYVTGLAGSRPEHAISTYGSSELLLMAFENPLSISIRRLAAASRSARLELFNEDKLPNLFQYCPLMRYIESVNNELIFTSASGLPLIRFNLKDNGSILSYDHIRKIAGVSKKGGKQSWQLPFVTLEGRSDNTIVFYAANIYPENIRQILDYKPFLSKITGRFAMVKRPHKTFEQTLNIHLELRPGEKGGPKFSNIVKMRIAKLLPSVNLEYKYIYQYYQKRGRDLKPVVTLWPYQSSPYFKPGLKARYIYKE